ncbi:unnamed protein product [Ectocarpus sp. CCAP 1310/34]|nr:unnamed protein product [Ectocarpus sp. CCAP 1310/34]
MMALSVQDDETALELFRRAHHKPLLTGLAFFDEVPAGSGSSKTKDKGVGRGDVVELYGPSGSGKSEVLINVVARCVMPAWLGGEERPAVFFDNDGRLSILRLEQLLKGKISNNTTFQVKSASGGVGGGGGTIHASPSRLQQLQSDLEDVLIGCLRRLRVVRPAGLFELLAAIEVLRFELGHRPAVVVVDGMGSFFWQDKMAQSCGGEAVSMQGIVAKALVRLTMERPVVLFAAKNGKDLGDAATEHREYLPQIWQRAVTFRVLLQRRQKRPPSPRPPPQSSGGGGGGGALSLFTARVLSLRLAKGNYGGGGGSFKAAAAGAGRVGRYGAGGDGESRPYFFVVTDDGIHDVPAAATLGEGEGWEGR